MKEELNYAALVDRDVREAFPDDASVNEALRVILKAAQNLAAHLPNRATRKHRTPNYAEKTNCRVLATSGRRILYETPIRQSRLDLSKRIISNQRRLLQKQHPELKNMRNVKYTLQWREGNRWVTGKS